MGALFLFAAALQYNDPDPIRWMAIYGAACVISIATATGRRVLLPTLVVATVSLAWALLWASSNPNLNAYSHMFDGWEMKSTPIEEAREASGLLIVTIWMAVLAARQWRSVRKTRNTENLLHG